MDIYTWLNRYIESLDLDLEFGRIVTVGDKGRIKGKTVGMDDVWDVMRLEGRYELGVVCDLREILEWDSVMYWMKKRCDELIVVCYKYSVGKYFWHTYFTERDFNLCLDFEGEVVYSNKDLFIVYWEKNDCKERDPSQAF
jgi:hypothetical protein